MSAYRSRDDTQAQRLDRLRSGRYTLVLEIVFGSPDNFRSEKLTFDIAPFQSGYQALLGRTAFARFNAVPHYAYLKLKMPGPRGTIIVSRNTERALRAEECAAALAAEH